MKEYKWIDVKDLKFSGLREIRQHTVEQIKESVKENGFDEARVLLVIPDTENGKYVVAGGNHRLKALIEMKVEKVPCLIDNEGDLYQLAIQDNEAEKTYAPIDLFDYLYMIERLKKENKSLKEISIIIGWEENLIKSYSALLKNIVAEFLEFCKLHQKDRASEKVAITTFNFTEGWFRNSGLYELNEEHQLKTIKWFIEEKKCKVSTNQIQEKTNALKEIEEQIQLLEDNLDPTIDAKKLIESIENGEYTTERLATVIKRLNEGAKDKALFGVDCRDELKKLEDGSIDCMITDPPWGVEYVPSRKTTNPQFDKELKEVLILLDDVFKECKRVLKNNGHVYVFFPTMFFVEFKNLLEKYFAVYSIPLIWYKNNHNLCNFKQRYASIYETVFFCKMEKGDLRELNAKVSPDVLKYDKPMNKQHDAQKPEDLLEYLIKNSTGKEEVILDPFMGSGSTLIAAIKSGRHYIGFEKEKSYESNFKRRIGEILEGKAK